MRELERAVVVKRDNQVAIVVGQLQVIQLINCVKVGGPDDNLSKSLGDR